MRGDCHIHMVLDGVAWKEAIARHNPTPLDACIQTCLERYQALGYTYLRDGGDRWGVGKRARELAQPVGIAYRTPLSPLCRAGCYGAFIGETFATEKEYAQLVKKQGANGADFIKIMISGLMDFDRFGHILYDGPTQAEIRSMIHIAHEEGFSVMAHCNGAQNALTAAQMGVDSIEHGAYLTQESLCAMAENGVIWVPTLSTIGNLLGKGRFDDRAVAEILEAALENVNRYHALGGLVACGSDAGAWAVPHHAQTEEGWLQKAGLTQDHWQKALVTLQERF